MDEAFIQNPQHDVDDQDGHDQQQAQSAERRFKRLGRSLKAGADSLRKELCSLAVHSRQCVAQRNSWSEGETDGDGWKLAKMGDAEGTYFAIQNRYGPPGDKLAG